MQAQEWQAMVVDNAQHAGVLISVCRTAGSAPRDVGARMWWRPNLALSTIGGGQLEYRALEIAAKSTEPCVERFPLAARVGQCCGGTVWLYFEPVPRGALAKRPKTRSIALDDAHIWHDVLPTSPTPLYLFGLGHVGSCLLKLRDFLPCEIIAHDERQDHEVDALDLIKSAPAQSKYLIMTHSHALDLLLCVAILKRRDAAYCGLIGSARKRAQFDQKLAEQGLDTGQLTCPIGVPSASKLPAHIALSVAQELITSHAKLTH